MKKLVLTVLLISLLCAVVLSGCNKESTTANAQIKVGTWKTAQTIQPFFYQDFVQDLYNIQVLPFTNPGDQKTALLAGSLDMCGTTLVTAIIAASQGEPVVIVCGLCNKCSALVVRNDASHKYTM